MGVDYERLAFWEELAASPMYPAPDRLIDRARLKAALIALDPELPGCLVIDDIVEGIAERIYLCWWQYQEKAAPDTIGLAAPSSELRKLQKALSEWLDKHLDERDREGYLLAAGAARVGITKNTLVALNQTVDELIGFLEHHRICGSFWPRPRHADGKRQEQPRTTFFVQLYELAVELKDTLGLSNNKYGPGDRFIRECGALVGIRAPEGLRQLIQTSISRAAAGRAKMRSQ
jgi:hypothetical protein